MTPIIFFKLLFIKSHLFLGSQLFQFRKLARTFSSGRVTVFHASVRVRFWTRLCGGLLLIHCESILTAKILHGQCPLNQVRAYFARLARWAILSRSTSAARSPAFCTRSQTNSTTL